MFCYQCEQTAGGRGCSVMGVCGKDPKTSDLQDLLVKVLCDVGSLAHTKGSSREADLLVLEGLFTTVTNVNFDPDRVESVIRRAFQVRRDLAGGQMMDQWLEEEAMDQEALAAKGSQVGPKADMDRYGETLGGLKWLVIYGLKGTAAYADHAHILGQEDPEVFAFFHRALHQVSREDITVDGMLSLALEVGKVNLKVMEMLDRGNTGTYGDPVPTRVRVTPVKGKAILVSGHDLKDLYELLKQTEGKGINVYTHGEMLPCHGYPKLKAFGHLVGNYGGAWQDQQKEFDRFPGAILMTTNCIQRPLDSYKGRIFTTGLVAWPGVRHVDRSDFSPVIQAALEAPGFQEDGEDKEILVGFGHNATLAAAPKVIQLVKEGKIRHFFLIGGCDGAKSGRNYYTDFATLAPKDTVILTLACGKYRFNKLEFGDIEGIPRLLDMGQCNDAYSAIRVAVELAKAFDTDVNSLPLSLILSWYEQKAVCILLTLLHLGIKNIRLGPSLPAFISPEALKVLQDSFHIRPIGPSAQEDLREILGA
ncbi:hybrid cluster protein [Thermanaerovibrio acidaminovorans DSM 6589]|uniref:Hydroxylamine reductase n=1 Tax=Thermanaerovibrio acidaminovorans (strain ATCC 49978 / DSM 6589 / Su883) TaxID=525903 RepID=D1B7H3_THEAS|nr:hydroxylamine reductase [Thermanaerovibrio acidaminovorans]ACZ19964.1 hybrid cluster protein [Thermanaerovibrio acidaminovorans DSM 6589]